MKRGILFLSLSLLFLATAYAQSLSLSWTGGAISNEQTITIVGDTGGTVYSYIDCKNDGAADTVSVKVKKTEISLISGSENSFCWTTCYLPEVYVSSYSIDILHDSVSDDFSGEYKAKGNIGISTVRYTFFDMDNPDDSICVNVTYDCSLGAAVPETEKEKIEFSNAFPNPAGSFTSFSYSLPASAEKNAKLIIRDIVGNTISENSLPDKIGTLKVDTDHFTDGVYFYSLTIDEQPYFTRKLIIRH